MTDDQTRPIETPKPTEPVAPAPPTQTEAAPAADAGPAAAAVPSAPAAAAVPSAPAAPAAPAAAAVPAAPAAADAAAAVPAAHAAAGTPAEWAPESAAAPTPPPPAAPYQPPPSLPPATPTGPDYPVAATTPVVSDGGASRRRWIVALGAAGIAIALTVGGLLFLGRSSLPEALRYIPGDAPMVIEVRPELPGDQLQKLGNLLAHFPGFRDQATLPDKLDEALSRVVSSGTGGDTDYRTEVKPWLNGPMFITVSAPAERGGALLPDGNAGPDEMLVSATTNGAVACATVFEGESVTNETYRGLTLVLDADGGAACVIDGRQALIGEPATVRKALDAKDAGTGMDKSAQYLAARDALPADQLATFYVSGASVRALMPAASGAPVPGLDVLTGAIPDWTFVGVRAEDDALVVETVTAPAPQATNAPSQLALPPTHASAIAPLVPANTLLLIEDQGTGVSLQNLLARLKSIPEIATPLQMLDGMGGAGELVGWIDDAGISVSLEGTDPRLAVLLVARDDATARDRAGTISSLLGLLALSGGGGIDVQRTTVNGVEVTSVTIQDVGSLVPPGSVPGMEDLPATGPVSFSFAVRGRALLLTSGPEAMANVLNVQAGQSLADQAAFKQAGQRGFANSRTSVYLAAGAALDIVQPLLPPEIAGQWATELAPYLDPIQAIGFTISADASPSRTRVVFTVAGP